MTKKVPTWFSRLEQVTWGVLWGIEKVAEEQSVCTTSEREEKSLHEWVGEEKERFGGKEHWAWREALHFAERESHA